MPKLTPDQIETIRAERAAGVKLEALAAEYNVSTATIFYHTAGVLNRSSPTSRERALMRAQAAATLREQMRHEYERGATIAAVASKHGVGVKAARARIIRAGGTIRDDRGAKPRVTDAQIVRLYCREKRTMREVGIALRISTSAVCQRLKKMNIPARCKAKKETR